MNNMSSQELSEQVIDLQTRVSFQEDAIEVMSQQMAAQAESLRVAQQHIQLLNQKLNNLQQAQDEQGEATQERPPHY